MAKMYDVRIESVAIRFRQRDNRVPLKFGAEVVTGGSLCRAAITVIRQDGARATGHGETPIAVAWSWPCAMTSEMRRLRMEAFCASLADAWRAVETVGHPMEIGAAFLRDVLPGLLEKENEGRPEAERMPYLAALVCNSLFDLALYDAYGIVNGVKVFDCLNAGYMNHDLSHYYEGGEGAAFVGKYPCDYLCPRDAVPDSLPAWHLVGGKDPLEAADLTGDEPDDGYPVLLRAWIDRDGLDCLKIKLRGNDAAWDYDRVVRVGEIALEKGVTHLTADFNCMVHDPAYVCALLERLRAEHPAIYDHILYVEQPFPYEIEKYPIDVRAVSAMKPLFMDESAHDWHFVKMGLHLGWTGVALKTCKTLTGALLMLCWARQHGMAIMVQDLTNPMLAIIPHALLAANAGTIMGVEVNSMQFCPEASRDEARVHPGLFRRRDGKIRLDTLGDTGFGYRLDDIERMKREAGEGAV